MREGLFSCRTQDCDDREAAVSDDARGESIERVLARWSEVELDCRGWDYCIGSRRHIAGEADDAPEPVDPKHSRCAVGSPAIVMVLAVEHILPFAARWRRVRWPWVIE